MEPPPFPAEPAATLPTKLFQGPHMLASIHPTRLTVCAAFLICSIWLALQSPDVVDAQSNYRSPGQQTTQRSTSTQTTRQPRDGRTTKQQPKQFLSGGARSERVLRDILRVLQKMDERLQRMERIAGELQKKQ